MKRWIYILLILLVCLFGVPAAAAEAPNEISMTYAAERIANQIQAAVTIRNPKTSELTATLVCTLYDAQGKMLQAALVPVSLSTEAATYPIIFQSAADDSATMKAFLIDADQGIPCCKSIEQAVPEPDTPIDNETESIPIN